ncbi:MAG: hypothetical protein LAO21_13855 [Acidobacteriia bacterium]|nr:hypothetical protein [Terriglobia bacterium]
MTKTWLSLFFFLQILVNDRKAIEERISKVREAIAGLRGLVDQEMPDAVALGLTDACETVLRSSPSPLTSKELCEGLREMEFNTGRYSRPESAPATILQRFEEKGLVIRTQKNGHAAYEWDLGIRAVAPRGFHNRRQISKSPVDKKKK